MLWGYILPCAWLGKDWLGLVLVKNDRKNHFQTHWVLATYDWASALWLQQHSESAFLLGLPVQFHVGKPYFVTRFVFSRNVRNVHAVLGHDQWKTVHDNRRGGEEGKGEGNIFCPLAPTFQSQPLFDHSSLDLHIWFRLTIRTKAPFYLLIL